MKITRETVKQAKKTSKSLGNIARFFQKKYQAYIDRMQAEIELEQADIDKLYRHLNGK